MKITTEYCGTAREYGSLEEYAECILDGNDYGKGAMEAVSDTATNNSKAIGRLLDMLADKSLVTAEETTTIVKGYTPGQATFGS